MKKRDGSSVKKKIYPTKEEAKFYCMQHDMFLCKNCFDQHVNHRGAESIKNLLAKEFHLWNSLLQKIHELRSKLDSNNSMYKEVIDVLREYYRSENTNPSGVIFANSLGAYSGTA